MRAGGMRAMDEDEGREGDIMGMGSPAFLKSGVQ